MRLILASSSPRRAELLHQIGVNFEIKSVEIDETPIHGERPLDYVKRLAIEKAAATKVFYQEDDILVLGSDTAVIIDGEILGKPDNKEQAVMMLKQLSGNSHTVLTSVAIIGCQQEQCLINESKVTFSTLTDSDIEWYWSTGEPKDKAGAYGIQGKAAVFIKRLEGSFSGVMGLPLYETSQLLKQSGFAIT
ncbi:MAG: Maf family protein [Cycloclasticus sp.]|jgi:septum formation protein|nr:Maf family protein [Cycloclasticus sp.]MDF1689807.1 Maf family protein [Cycloclasticus sp.]MEE4290920.1 Maf family protein [Cycloclasticus sp.]